MNDFIIEILSAVSRFLNVMTGDTADITFSARSYRDGLWTMKIIDAVFVVLEGEGNHCERWWHSEVQRAQAIVDHHQKKVANHSQHTG